MINNADGREIEYSLWNKLHFCFSFEIEQQSCFSGVFYDDLREPEAIKLSDTIVQWSEERERGWKGFEQSPSSMHLVTFEDLTLQLGKPYLYLHQGNKVASVYSFTTSRLSPANNVGHYQISCRLIGIHLTFVGYV